jgi:hypothetical protein
MFEQCPECGEHTLKYDEYYKRMICYSCCATELSSEKIRNISLSKGCTKMKIEIDLNELNEEQLKKLQTFLRENIPEKARTVRPRG